MANNITKLKLLDGTVYNMSAPILLDQTESSSTTSAPSSNYIKELVQNINNSISSINNSISELNTVLGTKANTTDIDSIEEVIDTIETTLGNKLNTSTYNSFIQQFSTIHPVNTSSGSLKSGSGYLKIGNLVLLNACITISVMGSIDSPIGGLPNTKTGDTYPVLMRRNTESRLIDGICQNGGVYIRNSESISFSAGDTLKISCAYISS